MFHKLHSKHEFNFNIHNLFSQTPEAMTLLSSVFTPNSQQSQTNTRRPEDMSVHIPAITAVSIIRDHTCPDFKLWLQQTK